MLASLQRVFAASLLIFVAAWAVAFTLAGKTYWAFLGVFAIYLGYASVLAVEFLLMSIINRRDGAPRARFSQVVQAWWSEVTIGPRVFCWRQPFRSGAFPDRLLPQRSHEGRGVLLVHGFVCNRGVWNPWIRRLHERESPCIAVNLEPAFGPINGYVDIIDAAARRIKEITGLPPLIVAHSMGGLAVRAWLASPHTAERAGRVITIGTPHSGTWLARFSLSANGREMRPDGRWLRRLRELESPADYGRFTCFYSHCDNIVFPATNATLPGADNRHVEGRAHLDLLDHPEVFDEVLRALNAPRPA